MKDDILSLLLQAETEYNTSVKAAAKGAGKYVDSRREQQAAYITGKKKEFSAFEKTESEKLEQSLIAESEKLEKEAAALKAKMRVRQEEKADRISELLKEEVLSLLWR